MWVFLPRLPKLTTDWAQVSWKETSFWGVRISRLSWVENKNKMYYKVLIHSHFLFCYFKAGLQAAIVCPISKENIWRCNRSFYTTRFLASLYLFVFLSKNYSVKTTLKLSSYKSKVFSTMKTSPASRKGKLNENKFMLMHAN